MPKTPDPTRQWLHHWQDETDAAYLYRLLAGLEKNPARAEIYKRLAVVEDRHGAIWQKVLADHGDARAPLRPSARSRLTAFVARRFGPGALTNVLLREEGREVRAYMALYASSEPGTTKDAALRLARESAQHAESLGGLTERSGEPWHQAESGGLLRNIVYGFNDGLTANFGLVAGVLGANVSTHFVLLSGAAGLIADSLSMGSSGYLAAKSEQEAHDHEIAMEADEIRMMPEIETEELALAYRAKGMAEADAERLARDVMSDPDRALDEKVRVELGFGARRSTPMREGWVTGVSTAVGAIIPVAPFVFLPPGPAMWTSFVISMAAHFAVGAARSVFTGRGVFRSGIDMFLVGLGVAAAGYLIGGWIAKIL